MTLYNLIIKKILYFYNLITNPIHFPWGHDIVECKNTNNGFYKKFKSSKYDKFMKTIYLLDIFDNSDFTPKIININHDKLELITSYCGELAKINKLPKDWEFQLNNIRNYLLEKNILIKDWGLWEINPFVINNLCLSNNRLYFVDLGETIISNRNEINFYFDKKIKSIKLIQKYQAKYLVFHYIRRLFIIILRKIKRINLYYIFIFILIWNTGINFEM